MNHIKKYTHGVPQLLRYIVGLKNQHTAINTSCSLTYLLVLIALLGGTRLAAQSPSCNCTDYIYVNDTEFNYVHKFRVDDATGGVTEVGSPWRNGGISAPHGIAQDLNGNLYVAATASGDIFQLDVFGNITGSPAINNPITPVGALRTVNFGFKDGILYILRNNGRQVVAIDLCTTAVLGVMNLKADGTNPETIWGFYVDDTRWYAVERSDPGRVHSGSLDISLYLPFTSPMLNSGSVLFTLFEPNTGTGVNDANGMGITRDGAGNFYVVEAQNTSGNSPTPKIVKYSPSGNHLLTITNPGDPFMANLANGLAGWQGARGITYSSASDKIYVGSKNNCLTVFDTNLNELSSLNIGNPLDGRPKAIGIVTECCASAPTVDIDNTICYDGTNDETIFLQEVLECEGIIAEGTWAETADANGVFSYESCDESITVSGSGCATYVLTSDGTGTNAQCGAFSVTVEICTTTPPTASVSTTAGTCTGLIPNNDATASISSILNADVAGLSSPGTTLYDGPDYNADANTNAALFDVTGGTLALTNLAHNTTYVLRLFNMGNGCSRDVIITTPDNTCSSAPCPNPTSIAFRWADFPQLNQTGGTTYPDVETLTDLYGTELDVTVTVPEAGQDGNRVGCGAGCDFPFLTNFSADTDVYRFYRQNDNDVVRLTYSFSENIEIGAFITGGQRPPGNPSEYAYNVLTFWDGPDGTGNKVVSALPNPGGRAFITETGTAAAAINILTTGANVNPGNGFLSTTNEYVSVGYVEGTPRPWNVLQMGGASVRSITWDLYVSSVDVSPDISGGTHPDGYYGTNSRDLSVTLANLRNSGELSAYISSFPLETCAALVCVEPTATVAPNAGNCVSGQVANNATMALSAVVNGDEAGISLGATYTGAAYSDAAHIDVTSGSGTFTGLAHGTTYTIRVYNMDDACFTDYTVSTPTLTLPSVTLNDPADVCIDGADMNFIATPAGGVFTTTAAVGFTSNGAAGTATLDVSAAGAGTYDVTYTYTDANGCDASQTVSVTVSPEPMVGCPTDRSVCLGGAPIALMGGTPAGGTYSGTGVGGGLFDPVLAGVGTHTITYTYLDGNGCEASCSFLITVLRVDCGTFPWGGN